MVPRFGRPVPVLSMATSTVFNYIHDTHEHLLNDCNPDLLSASMATSTVLNYIHDTHEHLLNDCNPDLLSAQALEEYAQAMSRKGSPLQNCFGFIDGNPSCLQTWKTPESSIQWP